MPELPDITVYIEALAAQIAPAPRLTLMLAEDFVNLVNGEIVEFHNFRLRTESGRQDGSRLVLGFDVRDNPGFVLAIRAAPVRMGQEMRSGFEEDFDDTRTG